MIQTENLKKRFNQIKAVDDVTLSISEKEIFGLVGPDGAGKTTLMRIICGLIVPDSGKVTVTGRFSDGMSRSESCLGYMPQRFSLYGDLTVIENINLFGSLFGLDGKKIKSRSDEILETTNLYSFKDRLADNLSGGMKQKLSLTCALITKPEILVLDEPTFGVDPESRKDIWKILYRLNKEGMTVLVSTPYMDEAELCTKVAFINNGKIISQNSPSGFKKNFNCIIYRTAANAADMADFKKSAGAKIIDIYQYGEFCHIIADNRYSDEIQSMFGDFKKKNGILSDLQVIEPSMEDIFVFYSKEVV